MTAVWWGKDENDGFVPLLPEQDGDDEDDPQEQLGTIQLQPSRRQIQALAVLQRHSPVLNETSLSVLGGVLIRLQYFAREHPAHGNSANLYWTLPGYMCYGAIVGCLIGKLTGRFEGLADNPFFYILVFLVCVAPLLFFDLDTFHRKSSRYQTALRTFQDGARTLLEELNSLLQPHGYVLNHDEPDAKLGTIEVKVQRMHNPPPSLPAVSQEFRQREKPLTEISAVAAMHNLLAKGVPIDEWTLGALMMRLRCAQKELRNDGKVVLATRSVLILTIVLAIGIDCILYSRTELGDFVVAFWWLPLLLFMVPMMASLAYCIEWLEGDAKHKLFRSATEKVSALARLRHGVTLVYQIRQGRLRGTTSGVVQFVPLHSDEETSTLDVEPGCVV